MALGVGLGVDLGVGLGVDLGVGLGVFLGVGVGLGAAEISLLGALNRVSLSMADSRWAFRLPSVKGTARTGLGPLIAGETVKVGGNGENTGRKRIGGEG